MASDMPRSILRNCNLFLNRVSMIGQVNEITLPTFTRKAEEMRNAGMEMPIDVMLGYEKLEASFKMPGFSPDAIRLFGLAVGDIKEYMAAGALAHEDGTIVDATAYMRGIMTAQNPGAWTPGELGENEYTISLRHYRLEIGGTTIIEADPFEVSIGGVSQTGAIRAALMV